MKSRICLLVKKYKQIPVQVKASIWYLMCTFLQKGISVISTPIFTRIMTTEEYGEFSVFYTWFSVLSIFVTLYLFYGVHTVGLVKYSNERDEFTSSLEGLNTTLIFFWTLIYLSFNHFFNNLFSLNTSQVLMMLSLMWTYGCYRFWANEQRVNYSYKSLVIITILVSVFKPLLEILLVLNCKEKATARIIGWLIVEIIAYSWMYIYHLKKGRVFYSLKYWKDSVAYCVPLVPHFLSQTVLNSSDRIMIQRMVGDSEAGIYSLAYSIALLMTLINQALIQTITPWIYQKIKNNKIMEISDIARMSLLLIAVCNFLFILIAPEAVSVFAPKSYRDAIWIIPPVSMSVLFMFMYDMFSCFAFYYEKTKMIMFGSITIAIINIGLNYIFINKFGYIAAGYTTLVGYIGFAFIHYIIMKSICNKEMDGKCPFNGKKIVLFSITFLTGGLLLLMTYKVPVVRYSVFIFLCIITIIFRKRIIRLLNDILKARNIRAES